MRKLLYFLFSLNLICVPVYAGTISIEPFTSGADVTIAHLESQRTTISNVINGNIEGGTNIKSGSLVSADFANSVSIVKFRDEAFNDFTFSGMLPATSASLTSDISAGISYVNGARIDNSAQSHTYTASKDTYVYITAGGSYAFEEVANGASAPSTPSNSLLLAKAVTSGTAITSVSDLRTLAIQITANTSNFPLDYRDQALVVRDSGTTMHVEPGQIAIGQTLYTNTSDTSSYSTATAANWIDGVAPTMANLKFYVYAYNNSGTTYDVKYSTVDPVNSDTSSGTSGTLRYYTTGGVTYRAIGWVSADSTGAVDAARGQFHDVGITNQARSESGTVTTGTTLIPDDNTTPQISEGIAFLNLTFRPTNVNNRLIIDIVVCYAHSSSSNFAVCLFRDSTANALATQREFKTADDTAVVSYRYSMLAGTLTPINFKVRCGGGTAGTTTFNGRAGADVYNGTLWSSLTVTEVQTNG